MNFTELRPGTSVEGEKILTYRSEYKSDKYIYIIGGVHGDEVEGVYIVQKLYEWLKGLERELPIVIIPILNPDGYRAQTRVNAHGVDLNRNLPAKSWTPEAREEKYYPGKSPLSEPENKFLEKLMGKFWPKIIFSFHSWKPMINYNGDCKNIAEFLERYNSYPICDDIEGHPTPGSLGDFAPESFKSPVITFESPLIQDRSGLLEIWEENRAALTALFQSDLLSH